MVRHKVASAELLPSGHSKSIAPLKILKFTQLEKLKVKPNINDVAD